MRIQCSQCNAYTNSTQVMPTFYTCTDHDIISISIHIMMFMYRRCWQGNAHTSSAQVMSDRSSCRCSLKHTCGDNCGNSSLVFSEHGSRLEESIPEENFSLMFSYHRNRLVDLHGMYIKLFIEISINRFMLVCHRQGATQCSRPHTPLIATMASFTASHDRLGVESK